MSPFASDKGPATPCDLCNHTRFSPFLEGRDRQHGVAGVFRLSRCQKCRLVFLDPIPSAAEIASFYPAGDYYAYRESPKTFREVRVSALKRFVLRGFYGYPLDPNGRRASGKPGIAQRLASRPARLLVSRRNIPHWRGRGRVLDVGCGVGSVLWRLRALGWDVRGVELDAHAARVGSARGIPIHSGTLEEAAFEDDAFDVVRMSHVLEHLRSPSVTMAEVRRVLAPGGRLLVMLPNLASVGFRMFGACWFPLELPRHLFHFTPRTFGMLAEKSGFRVLSRRCSTGPGKWLESWQYRREERAGQRGTVLNGRRMQERRAWQRIVAPLAWLADRAGVGDLMEFECE